MRVVGLAGVATVLLACSSPQAKQTRALMESPIAPASDAIFNAVIYTNGQLAASPRTNADWDRLRTHAQSLVAAGARLKALAPLEAPAGWIQQSDALSAASTAVVEAVDDRDIEGVLQSGSRIYDTCTACHAAYVKED